MDEPHFPALVYHQLIGFFSLKSVLLQASHSPRFLDASPFTNRSLQEAFNGRHIVNMSTLEPMTSEVMQRGNRPAENLPHYTASDLRLLVTKRWRSWTTTSGRERCS